MDLLLLQFAALVGPLIISRFMDEMARRSLTDEQRSQLVDAFVRFPMYAIVALIIPLAFIYNNFMYVSAYVGLYCSILLVITYIKVKKIGLPTFFMQRYLYSKLVAAAGIVLYFILFWMKYLD